jgi:resuscitation-promoting factor RpfB
MKAGARFLTAAIAGLTLAGGAHSGAWQHLTANPAGAQGSAANAALGRRLAAARGWTGHQWNCLDWLWTRESRWRLVWNYAGSGAFGIPQALPASKMASAGADYMTDPATQIRWGLGYIRSDYGTPCNAWSHEKTSGWY